METIHSHLSASAVEIARKMVGGSLLAGEIDRLLAQAAPVIHLEPVSVDATKESLGRISQIGGVACLPPGIQWPTWDPSPLLHAAADRRAEHLQSHPSVVSSLRAHHAQKLIDHFRAEALRGRRGLSLLATLDLASTPEPWRVGLPDQGVLWFFADRELYCTERDAWTLVWCDADVVGAGLVEHKPPENTWVFPRTMVRPVPGVYIGEDAVLSDGRRVEQLDLIGSDSPDLGDFESVDQWKAACNSVADEQVAPGELIGRLNRALFDGSQSIRSIGSQDDWCRPRMYAEYIDGHTPRASRTTQKNWPEIEKEAKNWRCLLAFDSDEATFGEGWKWGDVGQLQLWIRDNDLMNRRFDETQLYCNTT